MLLKIILKTEVLVDLSFQSVILRVLDEFQTDEHSSEGFFSSGIFLF